MSGARHLRDADLKGQRAYAAEVGPFQTQEPVANVQPRFFAARYGRESTDPGVSIHLF